MTTANAEVLEPQRAVGSKQISTAVKNVSWIWAGLLVNIGVSFFLAPFVVRSLGNVYYGIWTLLNQFTGYLWLFDFGVRESVIKYVAQYYEADQKEQLNSVVHASVSLYSVISALVMVAVAGMTFALPYFFNIPAESVGAARLTLFITAASIAQGFVFNVYVGVLMGIQRFYLVDRIGILFTIPRTILIVVMLSAGHGIVALALITFTLGTLANLIVYRLCRIHVPYLTFRLTRPRREDIEKIVGYGKYVLVNNIGEKLVYASDGLVIGVFLPVANLTYFAIAASLIGYLKSFVVAMASVLNPMTSALESKNDEHSLRVLFLGAARASVLLGLPVCVGFIVLGERFINIWMGPSFGPVSGQLLIILAAAHLIGLPYYTITGVLYGLAKHRIAALLRIFEAAVNLLLSVILVRRYGLMGVAIGTMIPHVIVAAGILPAALPKLLPVRLRDYYLSTYLRPLLASIPFWLVCFAIDRVLAPTTFVAFMGLVATGLVAYVVPCWLFALSQDERRLVKARVGRMLAR